VQQLVLQDTVADNHHVKNRRQTAHGIKLDMRKRVGVEAPNGHHVVAAENPQSHNDQQQRPQARQMRGRRHFLLTVQYPHERDGLAYVTTSENMKAPPGHRPVADIQLPNANYEIIQGEADGQTHMDRIQNRQDPANVRPGNNQAQMEHAERYENHAQLQNLGPKKGVALADVWLAEMKDAKVP